MNWIARPPLILDFDGSVNRIDNDEIRLNLKARQEELRFGCSRAVFRNFEQSLTLPPDRGCLFLGSGDYHHLSLIPLKKLAAAKGPLDLVVCDNHPDNMRYPFGLHCGSWVRWAAALEGVRHVHVLGITSSDIAWNHAWENNWRPLYSGRLTYWSLGRKAAWLKFLGRPEVCRSFATADEMLDSFRAEAAVLDKVYLSIDKDVFNPETVKTNWDQGQWEKRHLETLVETLAGRLVGADVTGEVSVYEYQGLFKKILARAEGLEKPDPLKLETWREEQRKMNLAILAMLERAGH